MRIGIPDDYADVVRTLPSFAKMSAHAVSIWTDAVTGVDATATGEPGIVSYCHAIQRFLTSEARASR